MQGKVEHPSDKVSEHNVKDNSAVGDDSWAELGSSEDFPEGPSLGCSGRAIHRRWHSYAIPTKVPSLLTTAMANPVEATSSPMPSTGDPSMYHVMYHECK